MQEGEIYTKAKAYFESESFPLPRTVFREFYSQLIKLSGFGLGGIFVLSGKKAGYRAASYLKSLIGESLTQEDIKVCVTAALQSYNQKVVDLALEENYMLIKVDNSIFADGITSKKPVCLPLAGSLAGMMETFTNSIWEAKEISCKACGDLQCVFELKRKNSYRFKEGGAMELYADKIKIQRKKKGMTIKELAKKIDCSDAYISQIESGKVMPSMKVLKKIVDTLDISFGEIFASSNQKEKVFFKKNEYYELRGFGNPLQEKILCTRVSSKKMQPMYKIINPNMEYRVCSRTNCEKFGFVIKGIIQINMRGIVVILKEQDSFYVSCLDEFTIKNIWSNDAELLCIETPPNI